MRRRDGTAVAVAGRDAAVDSVDAASEAPALGASGRNAAAVCLVHVPGQDTCTGTLLTCNGAVCVLCSLYVVRDAATASRASAHFFFGENDDAARADGSERAAVVTERDAKATARLDPRVLFAPIPAHGLVVIGVDRVPLRSCGAWPLVPAPGVLRVAAQGMTKVGDGPRLDCWAHEAGGAARRFALYVDGHDDFDDRVYFKEAAPTETHGAPLFYRDRWVAVVTEERAQVPHRRGAHAPFNVRETDRGVGVEALFAGMGVFGIAEDGPDSGPQSVTSFGAVPLTACVVLPRLPAAAFAGRAQQSSREVEAAGGAFLQSKARNAATEQPGQPRHYVAALALKAVRESNVALLLKLHEAHGGENVRLLTVANGAPLTHAAAASGDGSMLVPMHETLGYDLGARNLRGDTAAHVAAYHGNVGALRVLRAFGFDFDSPNNFGRRPVESAVGQRQSPAVDWFRRRGVKVPQPEIGNADDRHDNFVTRYDRGIRAEVRRDAPGSLPEDVFGFGTIHSRESAYAHAETVRRTAQQPETT
ncbi:hypothetical protein M885DRAFT_504311 [Pelagophyceae sp. CCMP2097]|nr:hypothetical protein M885DRAFT_504311 [Pelagophyceae sp. CCMP2097]|mmetsp:Transcript_4252/g.14987  ORF Transcript_4252/g.14987 Transcript_4252/m.14987 type:complete len:533 (-) Transcript_4252:72-1670(-)